MKTALFFVFLSTYMAVTPLVIIPFFLIHLFSPYYARSYMAFSLRFGIRIVFFIFSVKLIVTGRENLAGIPRNICVMGNHQSMVDILAYYMGLPFPMGFVAKKELLMVPFINVWMWALGCLFIDRKRVRKAVKTLNKAEQRLKKGFAMVIFPEGTRSRSNDFVAEFKKGSFKIPFKAHSAILPVTLKNSFKVWEEKGGVASATIYLHIHPYVLVDSLSQEEFNELPERLHDQIQSTLFRL